MHRDAVFCDAVHFAGADLYFQWCRAFTHYRRMKRLIAVRFGVGDIIIELVRQRMPQIMDNPQRGITIRHRLHDNPQREQVVNIIKIFAHRLVFLSFLVNTVNMLGPTGDFSRNPGFLELLF